MIGALTGGLGHSEDQVKWHWSYEGLSANGGFTTRTHLLLLLAAGSIYRRLLGSYRGYYCRSKGGSWTSRYSVQFGC